MGPQTEVTGGEEQGRAALPWRQAVLEGVGVAVTLALLGLLVLPRLDVPLSWGVIGGTGAVWVVYRRWRGPYSGKRPAR